MDDFSATTATARDCGSRFKDWGGGGGGLPPASHALVAPSSLSFTGALNPTAARPLANASLFSSLREQGEEAGDAAAMQQQQLSWGGGGAGGLDAKLGAFGELLV
jgi:hypothetical protein